MIVDGLPLDPVLHHQFQRVFFSKSIKNYYGFILGVVVFLFLLFLSSSSSISSSQNMWNFPPFSTNLQITTQRFLKGFSATFPEFPSVYRVVLTSFYRILLQHLPNLFNACWLLRISSAEDFNQWETGKYLKKKHLDEAEIWHPKVQKEFRAPGDNRSHDLPSSGSSDAHVFYYVRPLRFSKNINVWMSPFSISR